MVDTADEIAKFQELPDVAVLVRLSFPPPRRGPTSRRRPASHRSDAERFVGQCLRAGMRVAGFTFHVGGPTASAASWAHAIRRTLALMRRLEHAYGIRFDTLDLGGGLPVARRRAGVELATLARGIRAALVHAPSRYRIVIERIDPPPRRCDAAA